jgi:3-deoxy-D-manno-octulosonic-acid transferase
MLFLYNIIVQIANFSLKIIAAFSPKIKLFVDGRKPVFDILVDKIKANDKTIWFHAASLGEYEQGLPVIEKIKEKFPNHKIVVTFFSPSVMKSGKTTPLPTLPYICLWTPKKMRNNFYN